MEIEMFCSHDDKESGSPQVGPNLNRSEHRVVESWSDFWGSGILNLWWRWEGCPSTFWGGGSDRKRTPIGHTTPWLIVLLIIEDFKSLPPGYCVVKGGGCSKLSELAKLGLARKTGCTSQSLTPSTCAHTKDFQMRAFDVLKVLIFLNNYNWNENSQVLRLCHSDDPVSALPLFFFSLTLRF